MRAVIGPNGAGKSTMMDIITGKTRPDAGRVVFGADTTSPVWTSRRSLAGYRPQVPETDCLRKPHRLGQPAAGARRRPSARLHASCAAAQQPKPKVEALLETIRLTSHRNRLAANLSHGQKQWLEIGMLLAQDPQLLLVDEPVAGMTDSETEQTAHLLRDINRTRSVVVVEHDMAFVRALGVKVTVLHEGSVLSEGTLDHVSADPRVIDVYLGR